MVSVGVRDTQEEVRGRRAQASAARPPTASSARSPSSMLWAP